MAKEQPEQSNNLFSAIGRSLSNLFAGNSSHTINNTIHSKQEMAQFVKDHGGGVLTHDLKTRLDHSPQGILVAQATWIGEYNGVPMGVGTMAKKIGLNEYVVHGIQSGGAHNPQYFHDPKKWQDKDGMIPGMKYGTGGNLENGVPIQDYHIGKYSYHSKVHHNAVPLSKPGGTDRDGFLAHYNARKNGTSAGCITSFDPDFDHTLKTSQYQTLEFLPSVDVGGLAYNKRMDNARQIAEQNNVKQIGNLAEANQPAQSHHHSNQHKDKKIALN